MSKGKGKDKEVEITEVNGMNTKELQKVWDMLNGANEIIDKLIREEKGKEYNYQYGLPQDKDLDLTATNEEINGIKNNIEKRLKGSL